VRYARNARTHSPEQVAQIAASIRDWGWTTPVLVDEQGTIIAGHGRISGGTEPGHLKVEFSDVVGQAAERMRLPPPSATAISRMEATLDWAAWLEPIDSKIVWMRACGSRWKEVCSAVGLARAAAHEHWLYALCLIASRLNRKDRPKHVGRRRLIARVRSRTISGPPS
jgi:hypothetical protein